jgi:hypothetical protein
MHNEHGCMHNIIVNIVCIIISSVIILVSHGEISRELGMTWLKLMHSDISRAVGVAEF